MLARGRDGLRRLALALGVAAAAGGACAAANGPAKRKPPAPGSFFAAIGFSAKRDVKTAAEAATRSMLAKFRARRRRPDAVIFLERTGARPPADGGEIGRRVRAIAGSPTYGTGGPTGTRGLTWWAKQDHEPTFQVLGLAGEGLGVVAWADAGRLPSDRQARRRRAAALGRQVRTGGAARLALVLGDLGDGAGDYLWALRQALPADVPLLGAAGGAADYVYRDGRRLTGPDGRETARGQLVVTIAGPLKLALAACVSRNEADAPAVLAEADQVARRAVDALAGETPRLVIAFSSAGRLRTSRLYDPRKELARLEGVFGKDVPVFGCFSRVQVGVDSRGRFSLGRERLMLAALAAAEPADKEGAGR